jgi:hypothetical protein
MARLLLIAVVIGLLLWLVRRALGAGPRSRSPGGAVGGKLGPPEHLVCGECGNQFNADKNNWICPRCGK